MLNDCTWFRVIDSLASDFMFAYILNNWKFMSAAVSSPLMMTVTILTSSICQKTRHKILWVLRTIFVNWPVTCHKIILQHHNLCHRMIMWHMLGWILWHRLWIWPRVSSQQFGWHTTFLWLLITVTTAKAPWLTVERCMHTASLFVIVNMICKTFKPVGVLCVRTLNMRLLPVTKYLCQIHCTQELTFCQHTGRKRYSFWQN